MLMKAASQQRGFSLVELMIALTLGLVVMGGALSIVVSTLTTNTEALKITRLNQELRAVMMMLTRDLRRAGHWGLASEIVRASSSAELTLSATSGSNVTATSNVLNTFANLEGKIVGRTLKQIGVGGGVGLAVIQEADDSKLTLDIVSPFSSTILPANTWTILSPFSEIVVDSNCILFTYDRPYEENGKLIPPNGVLNFAGPNERYGFRLNSERKAIEMRQTASNCTDTSGWRRLTDEHSVDITDLEIENLSTSVMSAGYEVEFRKFKITLTGRLKDDPIIERTIQSTINVRNHQIL
jgi:prepilin-type N-terminal cleavage/methylation domain-containing protein